MNLYYIHDPMCSWCWGFKPVWKEIRSQLPAQVTLKYLLGGLAPDSNEPMPRALQKDIANYWKKIQKHIPNTDFNYDFWEECKPRRSTYPACRAVIACREQDPTKEIAMIEAIQQAYYREAKNPSNDDVLINLAKIIALDIKQFTFDLNAQETQQQLEKEMTLGKKIGAHGFPSLIMEIEEGNYIPVPLNYNDSSLSLNFIKKNTD